MATISRPDILTIIKTWKLTGDVQAIARIFEFQGFAVDAVYNAMKKKEPNGVQLYSDIQTLLIVVMTRGTNQKNILARSSDQAKKILQDLIKKYDIQQKGEKKGPEVITLQRISAAFPHICFLLVQAGLTRDPVTEQTECPPALRFPTAPALIDTQETLAKWLPWGIKFDAVINTPANPANVQKYSQIAFRSPDYKGLFPEAH